MVLAKHHRVDDDHHLDDDDDHTEDEPLTFKEIRQLTRKFEMRIHNFSLSIGKSIRTAQDCDVDKTNMAGIYNGLKSTAHTFDDFEHVGDEIMESFEDMAKKQGLPVKLPCMSTERTLRDTKKDDMDFNEMMMFWQSVKLDAMCVRGGMKNVAKIMNYFSKIDENEDGLKMAIAFGKMKYYLEHMTKVSQTLKRTINHVMQGINIKDKINEDLIQ